MDLVNRHRLATRVDTCPVRAVSGIAPFGLARLRGERGGGGAQFGREREGVRLERLLGAIGPRDPVLVGPARADVGHEHFPNANVCPAAHRVAAVVPVVEVAHH